MKQKNLYNVAVVGSFTKHILVRAEDEGTALDFAQSICDNTDLIRFEGDELLEVTAEDVEKIDPTGVDEPAEECSKNCRGNCAAGCGGSSCDKMADDESDEEGDEDDPCLRSLLSAGEETSMLRQIAGALLLDNLMGRLRD